MFREMISYVESWLNISPKEFRVILFFFILLMAAGMLFVWSNVKMVNLAYEYQNIKREHRKLIRENRLLALERASLQSLYRIQNLADERLGMRSPANNQVVTIFLK